MTRISAVSGGFHRRHAFRFAKQIICGRWITLFSSLLIMAGAGGTYLFGIYSKEIKSSLGYDQSTLNLIGFFKDLGANIGIFSGLIAEVIPTWLLLLIGSAMNFSGFFMIWLAVTGEISHPALWQMCVYMCIGANAQNFANTGALVTSVKNFPENRGILVGLLKGFTGLSGAIMTQLYLAIYGNNAKSLIFLIGWLPAAVSLVSVYTIRPMKVLRQPNELRVLYKILVIAIVLALFLMVMAIIEKVSSFSRPAYAGSATVVCILILLPLYIIFKQELLIWKQNKAAIIKSSPEITIEKPSTEVSKKYPQATPILPKSSTTSNQIEENKPRNNWLANILNKPERGDDYTILQALISMDMLILFFATACGLGSSLTALDNLGQIGESLGYPSKSINTFVSLGSIWNFFGRIFAGFVSENLLIKYKFPRPLMTTLVLLLSCASLLLVAFPVSGSVYMASVIIGFSCGAQFPLMNTIVSELFGLRHYATLFNFAQLAIPLGSYMLNVKVTGPLYDREALRDLRKKNIRRSSGMELTCMGSHCFRLPFVILTAVTCFGALASLVLVARTRDFYKGDIYKKFRAEAEEEATNVEMEMMSSSDGEMKTKP